MEFIYKELCVYSYMFKLQSSSKHSPFDAIYLLRLFSTAQNSFWTHWVWCLLILLSFFVSPLPIQQNISLWGLFFFIQRHNKKSCLGWDQVNREGHAIFAIIVMLSFVKNCWTLSTLWAGVLINHTSWNGQMCWKSLQKNSLKQNAASHNNASWYTDTDGFLEHSPSGRSLYYHDPSLKIILVIFLDPPCIIYYVLKTGVGKNKFTVVSAWNKSLFLCYHLFLYYYIQTTVNLFLLTIVYNTEYKINIRPNELAHIISLYKNQIYYEFIDFLNPKGYYRFLSWNYVKYYYIGCDMFMGNLEISIIQSMTEMISFQNI